MTNLGGHQVGTHVGRLVAAHRNLSILTTSEQLSVPARLVVDRRNIVGRSPRSIRDWPQLRKRIASVLHKTIDVGISDLSDRSLHFDASVGRGYDRRLHLDRRRVPQRLAEFGLLGDDLGLANGFDVLLLDGFVEGIVDELAEDIGTDLVAEQALQDRPGRTSLPESTHIRLTPQTIVGALDLGRYFSRGDLHGQPSTDRIHVLHLNFRHSSTLDS